MRQRYGIEKKNHPVIGVISRFVELKGLQYVIPAFIELRKKHPEAHLVLANAVGNYGDEIAHLLKDIPSTHYTIIQFEKDLFALYRLFDIFVHVPIDPEVEAYGQVYVEAPAAGIPSIFTLSGIARDFIVNEHNALVVPFKDSRSIHQSMERLIHDDILREKLIKNGRADVLSRFSFETMLKNLEIIYG
jgi:glycosyltransferase involved in cell wall biosynthesis